LDYLTSSGIILLLIKSFTCSYLYGIVVVVFHRVRVAIFLSEERKMAKYKPYDYNQGVMLTVFLEEQVVPGTLEFAIHTLVEERIDTSIFDDRYRNDETGCWAYDPKVLLKVVLLAYSRGLISSRKIERACRENV